MTLLRGATVLALVLTLGLIVLGAAVRATGSGLACPDWPTCYGHLVPLPADIPADAGYGYPQVMLEWGHRLVAGVILGPLILVIGLLCWRARARRRHLPLYGAALVVLLMVQALLGGITVLDQNSPWSVALHLATALLLFTLLWLLLIRAGDHAADIEPSARPLAALTWLLALATMVSAAIMTKSGASLACASWPLCDAGLLPDLRDGEVALNMTHRSLALLFLLSLLGLWHLLRTSPLRAQAALALALGVAEALAGGAMALLEIPLWAALGHQALGVLTFGAVAFLMWRCRAPAAATGSEMEHVGLSRA
jgi:cytochrome c oxidase assembly protein subunit 15